MSRNRSSKLSTSEGTSGQHHVNTHSNPKCLKSFYGSRQAHDSDLWASAGEFDLRPSMQKNGKNMYYDSTRVGITAIGARYNSYSTNMACSFIIDALLAKSRAYEVLLKAQEAAIGALRPGNKASAVYAAALSVVEREAPELVQNLTKSAGIGIGLEFCKLGLVLDAKDVRLIKPGMTFEMHLGLLDLTAASQNPETERLSLFLSDTVIVGENEPEIQTGQCPKQLSGSVHSSKEVGDDKDEAAANRSQVNSGVNRSVPGSSKATLWPENLGMSKKELRCQHQAELALQKIEETAEHLAGGGPGSGDSHGPARALNELAIYRSTDDLPHSKELMIQVDQKNEAVLLPIYGSMVSFPVSTVESVTSSLSDRFCTIGITFKEPDTTLNKHATNNLNFQGNIFVEEINFWSKDQTHISEVAQQIRSLGEKVVSREYERAERAALLRREKLQKAMWLSDLWIRPSFGGSGRKMAGSLEAHLNGFLYSTARPDERVDIMYDNIKHAFFQRTEFLSLLHFHLHNHIMVGNMKTKDVQFCVKVMGSMETLRGRQRRRSALDLDETEEEQRKRERKNIIDMELQTFVNRVNDQWMQPQFKGLDLKFDMPLREIGFHGMRYDNGSAFIVPTSTCLVELYEMPSLVVTLSEIEVVILEGVGFDQKNFDMTIVFKDFKKDVLQIDSIPSSSLGEIMEWLDTTDLKYYKSRWNLNWDRILKTITEDPEKFMEGGGWVGVSEHGCK